MTQSLPTQPSLEHLHNQAKALAKAHRAGGPDALARVASVAEWLPAASGNARIRMADALLVIAREYGFVSWTKLKAHVQSLKQADAPEDAVRGREIYERMIEAFRTARSLSFEIHSSMTSNGTEIMNGRNQVWLRKPFQARIESDLHGTSHRVGISDGERFWCYWPNGRAEAKARDFRDAESLRNQYLVRPAPTGLDTRDRQIWISVAATTSVFGLGVFHGGKNRELWPEATNYRHAGVEDVNGTTCDVVVLDMPHSSGRTVWVARADGLPRKHAWSHIDEAEMFSEETWTNVVVNGRIADDLFQWQPPKDWTEWSYPDENAKLIRRGQPAPDLDMSGMAGENYVLSKLRGQVIAMVFGWSCKRAEADESARIFQALHDRYASGDDALLIVASLFGETRAGIEHYMETHGLGFPVIHGSKQTFTIMQALGAQAPLTCLIIGKDGLVSDSWVGNLKRLEPAIASAVAA